MIAFVLNIIIGGGLVAEVAVLGVDVEMISLGSVPVVGPLMKDVATVTPEFVITKLLS